MPREIVHDSLQFSGEEPTLEGIAQVCWSREAEYVQLATTLVHSADHEPVEREVRGGWYVNLDRRGINQMIRNLRRARDQAFGRDE